MKVLLGAALLAACGSKSDTPASHDPVIAAAQAKPVKAFGIAEVTRIDDLDSEHERSYDELVERATASLGRPTLVDPAHASRRELTWAVDEGRECGELDVVAEPDRGYAIGAISSRDSFETSYYACVDAAHGVATGRRFADAELVLGSAADRPDDVEHQLAMLGVTPVRDERDGERRWIWASADDARCWAVVAAARNGHVTGDVRVATRGTPPYERCRGWAGGAATELWSADLISHRDP